MGIRNLLTLDPGADNEQPAWQVVEKYLSKNYVDNEQDIKRRLAARTRRRLYDSQGLDQAFRLIDEVFKDPDVRRLRKEVAPYARFDNALRRVINERSRVYAKPPKTRAVKNDTNPNYQQLQKDSQLNAAMRLANTLLSLQNDVLLSYRVRENAQGLREPHIDVLGPEDFFAVSDPRDQTKLIAVGINQAPQHELISPARQSSEPYWLVWTSDESFKLTKKGAILYNTIRDNPFGVMPCLLINADYRSTSLLDPHTGEDIVSAHLASWLANTSLLKEMKSLNKQLALIGEAGQSPSGQVQDSEADLFFGEGVGVQSVDRGVDLEKYMAAADHIIERAAANYGIPPSVLRHDGASSGYEIDLRRIPLEEIREDQIAIFRTAEYRFAKIQAVVTSIDLPSLSFDPDPWFIDFAEVKRPQPEQEKFLTRKLKRSMGHSDPILEAREDNPDFDEEMAAEWIADRMTAFGAFVASARTRDNVPADATVEDPGQSPEDNGAEGGEE